MYDDPTTSSYKWLERGFIVLKQTYKKILTSLATISNFKIIPTNDFLDKI